MTLFGKEKETSLSVRRTSSDGRSLGGESAASSYEDIHGAPSGSNRVLGVYHTKSHLNLTVTTADKTPLYYVNNSTFTIGTPDVTLHVGNDKKGPIKAACKFLTLSSQSKMCLGDPNDAVNVIWEDLKKESRDHSKYRWEMTIRPPGGGGGAYDGEQKAFVWKRTHAIGVEDSKPAKLSTRNFKLLDEATGEMLAVYANNGPKSYSKMGKFELMTDKYGDDWETMVLVSALGIIERERRRARARRNQGGGS